MRRGALALLHREDRLVSVLGSLPLLRLTWQYLQGLPVSWKNAIVHMVCYLSFLWPRHSMYKMIEGYYRDGVLIPLQLDSLAGLLGTAEGCVALACYSSPHRRRFLAVGAHPGLT